MQKYNWTETALHHHMLTETLQILFLHWTVIGNAQDIINQAKEMMMQTSTYKNTTGEVEHLRHLDHKLFSFFILYLIKINL
jgi:hypothetical protein